MWEFEASDEEDSEVIKPLSSASSGFAGTTPNSTTCFFNKMVTVLILLANYVCSSYIQFYTKCKKYDENPALSADKSLCHCANSESGTILAFSLHTIYFVSCNTKHLRWKSNDLRWTCCSFLCKSSVVDELHKGDPNPATTYLPTYLQ